MLSFFLVLKEKKKKLPKSQAWSDYSHFVDMGNSENYRIIESDKSDLDRL